MVRATMRCTAWTILAALGGCRSDAERLRLEIDRLETQRIATAATFEEALTRGDPRLRVAAARAAGRLRAASLASVVRRALAIEDDPAVRAEELFALGQIGSAEALDSVLAHLDGQDATTRARACEALGKLGKTEVAPSLVARLADGDASVRGAALLALVRLVGRRSGKTEQLDSAAAETIARTLPVLAAEREGDVAWQAAYAAAELSIAGRLPAALVAAKSEDAQARFFAAAALARLRTDDAELRAAALFALLGDGDVFVAAQAAAACAQLPASAFTGERLARLQRATTERRRASDHHLRAAAVRALVELARPTLRSDATDAEVPEAFVAAARTACDEAARDAKLLVRADAWRGLVRVGDDAAFERVVGQATAAGDVHARVAAVRALAATEAPMGTPSPAARRAAAEEALTRLAGDGDPYVASEALAALLPFATAPGDDARRAKRIELALAEARDRDYAVAANALDLLAGCAAPGHLDVVEATYSRFPGAEAAEARANAVKAAAVMASTRNAIDAGIQPPDPAAVALLNRALRDPSAAVRDEARRALERLGVKPEEGAAAKAGDDAEAEQEAREALPTIELDEEVVLAPRRDPVVRLRFAGGDVVVELFATDAPRHARMFRDRVAAGACDGLPIHRIVSGFVVQGLDPRGDGWGTGGIFLRDEIATRPFARGAIGMPNAGPDSGGCQLFAMLMPAPHLDGRYTVFGRVLQGMEVVDALDLGERCLRAEIDG